MVLNIYLKITTMFPPKNNEYPKNIMVIHLHLNSLGKGCRWYKILNDTLFMSNLVSKSKKSR